MMVMLVVVVMLTVMMMIDEGDNDACCGGGDEYDDDGAADARDCVGDVGEVKTFPIRTHNERNHSLKPFGYLFWHSAYG